MYSLPPREKGRQRMSIPSAMRGINWPKLAVLLLYTSIISIIDINCNIGSERVWNGIYNDMKKRCHLRGTAFHISTFGWERRACVPIRQRCCCQRQLLQLLCVQLPIQQLVYQLRQWQGHNFSG